MAKAEPWSTNKGAFAGFAIGALIVGADFPDIAWSDMRAVVFCAVVGMMVPILRNRSRKVGQWDPEEIQKNRDGRL